MCRSSSTPRSRRTCSRDCPAPASHVGASSSVDLGAHECVCADLGHVLLGASDADHDSPGQRSPADRQQLQHADPSLINGAKHTDNDRPHHTPPGQRTDHFADHGSPHDRAHHRGCHPHPNDNEPPSRGDGHYSHAAADLSRAGAAYCPCLCVSSVTRFSERCPCHVTGRGASGGCGLTADMSQDAALST